MIFDGSLEKSYKLWENNNADKISLLTDDEWSSWKYNDFISTKQFDRELTQKVKLPEESETNWNIVQPMFDKLKTNLHTIDKENQVSPEDVYINFHYSFERKVYL